MQPRCSFHERYLQIAAASVFHVLPPCITPAQEAAALQRLQELQEELSAEAKRDRFHFAATTGSLHQCVAAAYQETCYKLQFCCLLQAVPEAPVPKPQPMSDAALIEQLRQFAANRQQDTIFGEEQGTHP